MGRQIQNNFSGGCLSPTLFGRSDLQSYYKGCAKAENFVISKEGTLRKRHGIESVATLGSSFSDTKIIPYQFDRTSGGFLILTASGSTLNVNFYGKDCVWKYSASSSGFSGQVKNIQAKQIGDQVWITNGSFFKVITVANNSTISVGNWSQTSQPSPVDSLTSSGHKSNGDDYNPTERTITYAAYVVKDGVMSSRVTVNQGWSREWYAGYYISVDIGISTARQTGFDYIILTKKIGGSFGEVARWYPEDVDSNSINFRDENISAGTAVYAQTNVLGSGFANPVCVDCFQQRKVFANAYTDGAKFPMTMWFSEVGNLDNFYADRPAVDSDPFSPTISSTGPSFIRWIVAYQEMMVLFTDCGLFSVGFSQTQGFSGSTCRISRFSNLAVSPSIQPVVTDAGIVFVGADNKTIYTAAYDLQENMLKPINRTVLVEHLTRTSQVKALALQSSPDNVVWVVMDNGRYATFTFERNEEVFAWSDGCIDGASILDVIAPGTVTDTTSAAGSSERTYSDLVFVVEKNGTQYICKNSAGWADNIGGTAQNVKAVLVTLRPESQEKTISGYKKNIKDILLRLYNTGTIAVKPTDGGAAVPLVAAKTGTNNLFTGDVKVMPRGFIGEGGQMTFVSDDQRQCEILQIVTTMEVDG